MVCSQSSLPNAVVVCVDVTVEVADDVCVVLGVGENVGEVVGSELVGAKVGDIVGSEVVGEVGKQVTAGASGMSRGTPSPEYACASLTGRAG